MKTIVSPYELHGIEKGRAEGILYAKRDSIRRIARTLLGMVPAGLEAQLQQTDSPEALDELQERTLDDFLAGKRANRTK